MKTYMNLSVEELNVIRECLATVAGKSSQRKRTPEKKLLERWDKEIGEKNQEPLHLVGDDPEEEDDEWTPNDLEDWEDDDDDDDDDEEDNDD